MQPGQPYKQCPSCGQAMPLDAPRCSQCLHVFRTRFTPPDQTQAFRPGDPGQPIPPVHQPSQPHWQQPYPPYHAGNAQGQFMDHVTHILGNLPVFVCFLIGFFTNLFAIILMVLYFGYGPARDYQKGWATVYGFFTPIALWLMFVLMVMIRH